MIVVDGAPPPAPTAIEDVEGALTVALDGGSSVRDAAAEVATRFGLPKRGVYRLAVSIVASRR